jgi:hypothetical protein
MSRKVLTLSERVEAIKLHDDGKSSRDVAQIMGVGRTQIQQIMKRKSEVLDDYESNIYVIVCILIILYVFVFLFFFSIGILTLLGEIFLAVGCVKEVTINLS